MTIVAGLVIPLMQDCFAGKENMSGIPTDDPLDRYNVVWHSPSKDETASMPIGNGDIGANVWVDAGGELILLLSKTDTWGENGELFKLGRLRVKITPTPLTNGIPFKQSLRLRQGAIVVEMGEGDKAVALKVWIDARQPVIRIEASSAAPVVLQATLEMWRPDTVVEDRKNQITWYHRNKSSIYPENLKLQGMDGYLGKAPDPLLHRTFGGSIQGEGLVNDGPLTLKSPESRKEFVLSVFPLCSQTKTVEVWLQQLDRNVAGVGSRKIDLARADHWAWWKAFWERSWIYVTGNQDADTLTSAYTLQRWINACGGRGAYPIKFNGSIFTVDWDGKQGPDFRRWGQCYWWQNTRLVYWPMLASGDFDLMQPLLRMYEATIPLAEYRTKTWFQHEGTFIGETVHFWGMYMDENYGRQRDKDMPISELTNKYIRREYTASPELMAMMLDYYAFTGDESFLKERLLPTCDTLLKFWDQHYRSDENGHMIMYPGQALETLQDARNPAPDIAGLNCVLARLLQLPEDTAGSKRREFWATLMKKVPPLPISKKEEDRVLLGAEESYEGPKNAENPELYAIFPFRLYGVGKPDLELAQRTYSRRRVRKNNCWYQDPIQAAFLGLTKEAASMVSQRARDKRSDIRFPAFWGPNHDWTPDQDHGGVLMHALQAMIVQSDDGKIHLLPAWPSNWNVTFKLHVEKTTFVTGTVKDGTLQAWDVTPASRKQDVIIEYKDKE